MSVLDHIKINKGDYIDDNINCGAIVSVTNSSLIPMNEKGIDYKIFKHSNKPKQLKKDCLEKRGCPVGEAVITDSYYKPKYGISKIIHVVGPEYYPTDRNQSRRLLKDCCQNALDLAFKNDIENIVFPCIGLGHTGTGHRETVRITFGTVLQWLKSHPESKMNVCFSCEESRFYRYYNDLITEARNNDFTESHAPKGKEKIGLILQGGGAKGAFSFGAYQYLIDSNAFDKITGLSGTSIGALNTALFLDEKNSVSEKQTMWEKFDPDTLSFLQDRKGKEITNLLSGLIGGDEEQWTRELDVYTTVTENTKCEYRSWYNRSLSDIKDWVAGSAAHPAIFNPKEGENPDTGDKEKLIDGGTTTFKLLKGKKVDANVPIQPLYELGYRKFVVIYLNPFEKIQKQIADEMTRFGDAEFCRVFPTESLGDMKKISRELTEDRRVKGYEAMKKELDSSKDFIWWKRSMK